MTSDGRTHSPLDYGDHGRETCDCGGGYPCSCPDYCSADGHGDEGADWPCADVLALHGDEDAAAFWKRESEEFDSWLRVEHPEWFAEDGPSVAVAPGRTPS